jgi:hypothetical protein
MSSRAHNHTKLLLLLFAGWVSSITMLVPWPPATIAYVNAHDMRIPEWGIWFRWLLYSAFVLGGAIAALLAFRGSMKAFGYAAGFSVLYLGWWLSEHLLAKRPLAESMSAVVHHLQVGDTLSRLVVAQHQVVLPLLHIAFLIIVVLAYGRRRVAI